MQKIKDYIYYNRKELISIGICLLVFISYIVFNNKSDDNIVIEKEVKEETKSKIMVDIKGEVKNPGTYEFNNEERIIDAINKSGGLNDNANTDNINLSEKLKDEMIIYIPSKEANHTINKQDSNLKAEEKDNKISINTANLSMLMSIKGIGQKKAEAIIEYREKNGLFKDINDIKNVSGIGNSLFDKIKNYIKI